MKAKIIYIASFVVAFLLVTGGIIYFNSIYRNIFQFDFTPEIHKTKETLPKGPYNVQVAELKNYFQNEFRHDIIDTLKTLFSNKKSDTVYANKVVNNPVLVDSLKQLERALRKTDEELKRHKGISESKNEIKAKEDSTYNVWIKKTSRLYESMDPDKAAKIIQSYSDNVARDIIYSMRQQKAAEILSQLSPETANRITRAK